MARASARVPVWFDQLVFAVTVMAMVVGSVIIWLFLRRYAPRSLDDARYTRPPGILLIGLGGGISGAPILLAASWWKRRGAMSERLDRRRRP